MLSYLRNDKIKLSLIIYHDGTVYGIYGVSKEFEKIYDERLQYEKEKTNNIDEAKRFAMTAIYQLNDKLGKNQKLFEVRRL